LELVQQWVASNGLTLHPQTIGRAQNLMMLERFLDHVASRTGVWFATLSQIHDCWTD